MKRGLLFELSIYALCVTLAGLLWQQPVILSLCYLAVSILMLIKWHARSDLFFYFVALVLGPAGEIVAVYFGAWEFPGHFI